MGLEVPEEIMTVWDAWIMAILLRVYEIGYTEGKNTQKQITRSILGLD